MAADGVLSPPKTETSSTTQPASEKPGPIVAIPNEVHSVFSPTQKKLIVLTASTAAFFSPLSSNIYLPALNLIAQDLVVSDAKINLTITTYLIFQAVSPMIIAGFSDNAGRRPAYIICFILYIAANLGLALQENYIALLILRCLQSAGSSGTVAICQGVVSDVATSAERGTYVAYSSVSTVLGPTLSPIIGGLLSQYLGWKAIFWFLICFAVPVFILLMIFFPETCRKVVGNGSVPTRHLLNESLTSYLRKRKNKRTEDKGGKGQEVLPKVKLKFPNPLATLLILKNKEAALLMFFSGLLLAVHYIILASIPSEYGDLYNFNEMKIALVYIPYGLGSVLSAFTTGKLVNKNYQRHAKRLNFPLTLNKQLDLSYFPIEHARLEVALPLLYFGSAMIIIYGWILNLKVNVAGPLILLFFIGWSIFAIYQVTSILVVDIYPENPATATAANNLIRCMFSAGATAAVVPMLRTLGRGWTYTFTAFVFMALSPSLWLLMWYGPAWRREMKATLELRETEKRRRITG